MADKKFYWLKLKKDFFKRHDMTIVEGMPNGKDYLLFYLKLLVESLDHSGSLRFSETIPYSTEMLSSLTHTNVDVVRSALKVLTELQLIEILDDETIFMTEVEKMTGCESSEEVREQWRIRKQRQREKNKFLEDNERDTGVTSRVTVTRDKSIENRNNIYVSPEDDTEEIDRNFEIIYNRYPKKGTKASAKESYKKWIQKSGKKVGGKTYHLSNKQIWAAVDNYVKQQEAKGTELTYYKNFVTLMNQLLDWVVEDE